MALSKISPNATSFTTVTGGFQLPVGNTSSRGSESVGSLRYNDQTYELEMYNGASWITVKSTFSATGGTITDGGGYRTHVFTSSGSFTVGKGSKSVDFLVVAGGGGGSAYSGGGGGGGFRTSAGTSGGGSSAEAKFTVSEGTYTVTVGAGGAYSPYSAPIDGRGGNSSIVGTGVSIISLGGGNHSSNSTIRAGGSGCGGDASYTSGSGTSGQGYNGGTGGTSGITWYSGGGGGGAGAAGASTGGTQYGGAGGVGVTSSLSGTSQSYSAGAGGGCWGRYSTGYMGLGGDSSSVPWPSNVAYGGNPGNAPANRGGGGTSPSSDNGGNQSNGGSGIVVIRYSI